MTKQQIEKLKDKTTEEIIEEAVKEAVRIEWGEHIRFLIEHRKGAKIAEDLLYFSEMDNALEHSKNWYKNIYGEKKLNKLLKKNE